MKKKIFIGAAVIFSSHLQAQTDSSRTLDAIVVTANKIEQKQKESGKVLTIISQQQLQQSSGKTLGEMLGQQAGIHIGGSNNTPGTNQTVYVRGAVAANTLILLDGIPLYDASGISSEFDLNSFAPDQVERIEIMKGAQSTLYGSDAVAAVINIITKKSSAKKLKIGSTISAGSYNTYRGALNISGSIKNSLNYFLGYSKVYSDGFSAAIDSTGIQNFDRDGFRQDAVYGSLGFRITKKLSARAFSKFNINKAEIDAGAFTNDNDDRYRTRNSNTGISLNYQVKKTTLNLVYNYNWYDRNYINDSTDIGGFNSYENGKYNSRSHFAELYGNFQLLKTVNLTGGVDYRHGATSQSYYSASIYGPYMPPALGRDSAHSSQTGVYASVIYNNMKGFIAGAGGRWNHHSVYGSNATFSVNPSYQVKQVKIFATVSSAYRAPSLYQLYSEFGNRNLEPEKSVNYEAGLQFENDIIMARAVGFKRDIKNVFVFYTDPVSYMSTYINEDLQKDYGIELEAVLTLKKKLTITANYTYIDGKISTKDFSGKDTSFFNLYRIPKNSFNLDIGYRFLPAAFVSLHLRNVGSLFEPKYGAAPVKLANYYTLDLYGEYVFIKRIKLFADFRNITDQRYVDQEGFNTKRFNVNAGISINL